MFELISEEEEQVAANNSWYQQIDRFPSIDECFTAIDDFPIDTLVSDSLDFVGVENFFGMDSADDSCVKTAVSDPVVVDGKNGVQDPIGTDSCVEIWNSSEVVKEEMKDWSAAFVADEEDVPMVIGARGANLVLDGGGTVVKVDIEDLDKLGSVKLHAVNGSEDMPDSNSCVSKPVECRLNPVADETAAVCEPSTEDDDDKVGKLSFSIENELQKVSLVEVGHDSQVVDVNDSKVREVPKEHESCGSEESESSSSSSSSSSSEESSSSEGDSEGDAHDDDDDKKNKKNIVVKGKMKNKVDIAGQVEEGEIMDDDDESLKDMVESSEDDFIAADDEDDDGVKSGPIRSKNELKSLPPVPRVDVTLQPSHQTMPVGVILSVLGAQVIVEGMDTHNPLNEGSILWITERRIPLGIVDEIFGPVKNPYYIVRYNSESEVPDQIHQGTLISFVPEFAVHILNDKSVYQKGYDASGDNDEEVEEAEFSDDEKEAEYRRMLKNSKRGLNDQKQGNKKNKTKFNMNQPLRTPTKTNVVQSTPNVTSGSAPSLNRGQPGFTPNFTLPIQSAGPRPTPNGLVANGMQSQPQPNAMFPNGILTQNTPWPQQNLFQYPFQMPLMNGMPFQQTGFLPNIFLQGGHPSFMAGQAYTPWSGVMGQNDFNPAAFAMGLQGQQAHPYQNVGGQWVPFQNAGGQAVQFQNMGGHVGPYQNTGGQGGPSQNTGQWRPSQNMAGHPPQNMEVQPPPNCGGQQPQNIGGHGVPPMNTRGQGTTPQNAGHAQNSGGRGVSPQATKGHEVSSQEFVANPSTGISEEQNYDTPPGFPGKTEYRPRFNSNASTGRGRQPYQRGRGRFSRGRNPQH